MKILIVTIFLLPICCIAQTQDTLVQYYRGDIRPSIADEILLSTYRGYHLKLGYKALQEEDYQKGDRILCPMIFFYFEGGSRVHVDSYDSLRVIAEFIKAHPDLELEIGLFTDHRGAEAYNRDLSGYRARVIDKTLRIKFGLEDASNYSVKGYGESNPLIPTFIIERVKGRRAEEEFHSMNRRIELKVIGAN